MNNRDAKFKRRYLYWIVAVIFFIAGVAYCWNFIPIDWYFLVPTGKYIVSNGFPLPDTNPWFVSDEPSVPEHPYVIQQWLYCVYAYLIDACHLHMLSVLLFIGLIAVTCVKIGQLAGLRGKDSVALSIISLAIAKHFMFSLRPEALTIWLLLTEILALESLMKYQNTKPESRQNRKIVIYYITIFLTMLLEVNLHSSMWLFHVLIFAAYLMPFPKTKLPNMRLRFDKHSIAGFLLMCAGIVCSPIGTQPVSYIFEALRSNTFDLVEVSEMHHTPVLYLWQPLLPVVLLVYAIAKRKTLHTPTAFITVGFSVMMIIARRNLMFIPISLFLCLRDIAETGFMDEEIEYAKHVGGVAAAFLLSVLIFIGQSDFIDRYDGKRHEYPVGSVFFVEPAIRERESEPEKCRIYTASESGAVMEYLGYENIFIDARPEMFNRPGILDDMTVLEEQYQYFDTGVAFDGHKITDSEIGARLEKYDFEYFIVSADFCERLCEYLEHSDKYELIAQEGVSLYAKSKSGSDTAMSE